MTSSVDVDEPQLTVRSLEQIRRDKALHSLHERQSESTSQDKQTEQEPVVRMKPVVQRKPIVQKVSVSKISPPKKDRSSKREVQTYMPPALRNKGNHKHGDVCKNYEFSFLSFACDISVIKILTDCCIDKPFCGPPWDNL